MKSVDKAILVNSKFLDAIVTDTEIFSQQPDTDHHGERASHSLPLTYPSPTEIGHKPSHSYPHEHEHGGDDTSNSHSHSRGGGHTHSHDSSDRGTNEGDIDKVRSTLKQLVRDWSEEVSDVPFLNQAQTLILRRENASVRRATLQSLML